MIRRAGQAAAIRQLNRHHLSVTARHGGCGDRLPALPGPYEVTGNDALDRQLAASGEHGRTSHEAQAIHTVG
jgi:hypothetical protein